MLAVLRAAGAIVAGMIVAAMLLVGVELFGAVVHPLPPGFSGTKEELCRHVERYPAWVLAVVVPAWATVALAGTWLAGRLGNLVSSLLIGILLVLALVFNIWMLPYPLWFKIACLIAIPGGVLSGVYLSRPRAARLSQAG
jgi:hypothetical protein